jgi:protein-disulfide isomerase
MRFALLFPLFLSALPVALGAQSDPLAARSKGPATAPITVYEMSDFQCPFCKRHAEQIFPVLEREYIATGKVRWIFINLPIVAIHPNAVPAAEFAMCAARHDRFWPAHDILFRHQNTWASLKDPGAFLLALGDSLRLPKPALVSCLTGGQTRALVRDDAEGAVKAGAHSTPTFYVEGGLLVGAQPPEVWRPILDSIYRAKSRQP